jgi:hypothetical protein
MTAQRSFSRTDVLSSQYRHHHEPVARDGRICCLVLHELMIQAQRRPWVSFGWVRRYCWYSERASCFMSVTHASKGIG